MKKSIVIFLIVLAALVGVVYFVTRNSQVISDKPAASLEREIDVMKEERSAADELTPADKIKKAQALLIEARETLMTQGQYACCIKNGCYQCMLDHHDCGCYKLLKAGKPVCNECYAGWQRGDGVDKVIKPGQVKTNYRSHKH